MGHRYAFHVFFGDCDEAGIVFYPRYFTWFDNAFGDWCREKGVSQRTMRSELGLFGTPIVEAGASFRAPSGYDDALSVEAEITEWKDKSFRVQYKAVRGTTLVAEGFEVRVCVAKDAAGKMGARLVPAALKEALS